MFFWGKKGLKLRLSLVKIGNIALTLKKFEQKRRLMGKILRKINIKYKQSLNLAKIEGFKYYEKNLNFFQKGY